MGKSAATMFAFLIAILMPEIMSAQASHVALVVGNSRYENGPDLPNAATDARVVAQVFSKLGYQTLLLQDATRADMMIALANLRITASDASQVVIYFSGHGVQTSGESYLLMRDTTMEWNHITQDAVPISTLVRAISDQPRQKIILIDACRESPLKDAGVVVPSGQLFAPAGLLVAYSAQPGASRFLIVVGEVSPFHSGIGRAVGPSQHNLLSKFYVRWACASFKPLPDSRFLGPAQLCCVLQRCLPKGCRQRVYLKLTHRSERHRFDKGFGVSVRFGDAGPLCKAVVCGPNIGKQIPRSFWNLGVLISDFQNQYIVCVPS